MLYTLPGELSRIFFITLLCSVKWEYTTVQKPTYRVWAFSGSFSQHSLFLQQNEIKRLNINKAAKVCFLLKLLRHPAEV
jgi:hypothetical protein